MNEKNIKSAFESAKGFIRETLPDIVPLSGSQRVALNRRGNELFNRGEIDEALRIFCATDYRDGILRVGDARLDGGDEIGALTAYAKAKNTRKMDPICEKIAAVISKMISEEI